MAKKGFKDGMEDLFGAANEEKSLTLFPREEGKKPSKGFASQLDAFLAEAFEEEEKDAAENTDEKQPRRKVSGKNKQGLSGLDLLIRPTGDAKKDQLTRRLTLAFNKEQLEKLKSIARREGIFLKDLINELVERYIADYEGGR